MLHSTSQIVDTSAGGGGGCSINSNNASTTIGIAINSKNISNNNINDDIYHSAPTSPVKDSPLLQSQPTIDAAFQPLERCRTAPVHPLSSSLSPSMRTLSDPFVLPMPPKGVDIIAAAASASIALQEMSAAAGVIFEEQPNLRSRPHSPVRSAAKNVSIVDELKHEREEMLVDGLVMEERMHNGQHFIDVPSAIDSTGKESTSRRSSCYESLPRQKSDDGGEVGDDDDLMKSPLTSSNDDDVDVASLKGRNRIDSVDYTFAWSVATQKGYRYSDPHVRNTKLDIHTMMEDYHYPSYRDSPNHQHAITGRLFQIFLLADGHGGHSCAQYTVDHLPGLISDLVSSKVWNFGVDFERQAFRRELERIFLQLDESYCESKLSEFRQWIHKAVKCNLNPHSPSMRSERPPDDGCTVVLNIFYEGYLINANVGDSRSLLLARDDETMTAAAASATAQHTETASDSHMSDSQVWYPDFASVDHTPGHPERAKQIHMNGGRFIMNGMTASIPELNDFIDDSVSDSTFDFLSRCRIGRPLGWKIDELNFPACTTLNLTGTLGDLFFKYDPPLISAKPDVSFVKLQPVQNKYLMVMATDGLWDHMAHCVPEVQHGMVAQYVNATMEHADVNSFSFLMHEDEEEDEEDYYSKSATAPRVDDRMDTLADNGKQCVCEESTSSTNDVVEEELRKRELDSIDEANEDEQKSQNRLKTRKSSATALDEKLQKLGILAHGMADREMMTCKSNLYAPNFLRYDDVTVFVVLIEGLQPPSESEFGEDASTIVNSDEKGL